MTTSPQGDPDDRPMSEREDKLVRAVREYRSECENPVPDYMLRRTRRDHMFVCLAAYDRSQS